MILKIKACPNSKQNKIIKERDFYKVYVKESPENNKANLKIINLLKKYFKKEIKLIKGKKSKNKLFLLKTN